MHAPHESDKQTRQFAMIMHLSQLSGWLVPIAGWLVPIVLWQVKKDELPGIDSHGKTIVNWLLTQLLASAVLGILLVVFTIGVITIPLLIFVWMAFGALWLAGAIFAIVGAIKANDGEHWPYPGSIRFIS
ncbi:MAG: DUF4870 domain-containing protein [Planctomycetota bacterium]